MKKLILVLCLLPMTANAYFQMDLLKGKKTNKEATQWTLADWLTQKNKMSLLDQWLAMNRSANWFELNLSTTRGRLKLKNETGGVTTTINEDHEAYHADMYISFINLNGEYEKHDGENNKSENYGGALGIRLLGTSSQTTNLTLRYGWRKFRDITAQEEFENQYAEGHLQLYLISKLGLQGSYRHYFPNKSNLGTEMKGYRATAGAFVEFLIFRVYGNAYQEPIERTAADGTVTKSDRSGVEGGVKLFF